MPYNENMLIAATHITVDPTWPFNLPGVGLPVLAGVAIVLVALTIWTYVGTRKITRGKLLAILLLRLIALVVATLLVLRPSLATQEDDTLLASKLLVLVDSSESMNLTDEIDGMSRWDHARRILASPDVAEAVKDLALKHKIELVYYQGAEGIARLSSRETPSGKATGKRTDFGVWLHDLWQLHHGENGLHGLIIFSDGADNGTRYVALKQAANWAGTCPISTFGLGRPTTNFSQRDVALVDIQPPSQPVPVKTQFSVTGRINAFGFEGAMADVSLWIEDLDSGKLVMLGRKERIVLTRTQNNEVVLVRDAPSRPGEYKITLKVDPLPGEVTVLNNQISSYLTTTSEGVSILWVEGHKRLESAFALRFALHKDRRFRLYPAEMLQRRSDERGGLVQLREAALRRGRHRRRLGHALQQQQRQGLCRHPPGGGKGRHGLAPARRTRIFRQLRLEQEPGRRSDVAAAGDARQPRANRSPRCACCRPRPASAITFSRCPTIRRRIEKSGKSCSTRSTA